MAGDPSAPRDGMKSNPAALPHALSPEDLAHAERERAIRMSKQCKPDKPKDSDKGADRSD